MKLYKFKDVFYHLTQNTWRKIKDLGLAQDYKDNDDIKLFCGIIDSLAFLSCDQVLEGMEYLQSVCLEELVDLLTYFNTNYVQVPLRNFRYQQPLEMTGFY